MIGRQVLVSLATLGGSLGMYLMLPRGRRWGRATGSIVAAASLGLLAAQLPLLEDWASQSVFYIFSGVTILAAAATVSFRNPVYCAIWFGLSLLGTAGLFLFQGAQFLGVATIVVYAGAILVTFLFVLMLAQPEGNAPYDRLSWEALLSAATGGLLVGILTLAVLSVLGSPAAPGGPPALERPAALESGVLADEHMARLGGELFTRHLVAVEVAGTLLMAALVGSVAIVAHGRPFGRRGEENLR